MIQGWIKSCKGSWCRDPFCKEKLVYKTEPITALLFKERLASRTCRASSLLANVLLQSACSHLLWQPSGIHSATLMHIGLKINMRLLEGTWQADRSSPSLLGSRSSGTFWQWKFRRLSTKRHWIFIYWFWTGFRTVSRTDYCWGNLKFSKVVLYVCSQVMDCSGITSVQQESKSASATRRDSLYFPLLNVMHLNATGTSRNFPLTSNRGDSRLCSAGFFCCGKAQYGSLSKQEVMEAQ